MMTRKQRALWNYTPVFRPRSVPVPGIDSILEEPTVCVTFSQKLVPYLLGLLEIYRYEDRFAGTDDEIKTALGVFQDLVAAIAEGNCMPFQLRQNPDNSCQLQQSLDGGETWNTVFDYSLCVPPVIQTILMNSINNNTYVSPFTLNQTFISQSTYTDAEKEKAYQALCFAAQYVVQIMCQAAHDVSTGAVDPLNLLAAVASLIGALLAIAVEVVGAPVLFPLIAASIAAAIWAAAEIDAIIADYWLDGDNQAALACLMLANLANSAVTLENFQHAFDHAECLTSVQQSMAAVLAQMLSYPAQKAQLYAGFLANEAVVNSAAQSDALDAACGCSNDTWTHCLDLTKWFGQSAFYPDYIDVPGCTNPGYVPTHGGQLGVLGGSPAWETQPTTGVVNDLSRRFSIYIPSNATLTDLFASWDRADSSNTDSVTKVVRVSGHSPACVHVSGGLGSVGISGMSESGITLIVDVQFFCNNNQVPTYITQIELSGTGVNPFAACNNCS